MGSFLQNVVNALQWGSFYALIALGYSMVYSILMLFNFAHGDIFMTGSYIGFFIATGLIMPLLYGHPRPALLGNTDPDHPVSHVSHLFRRYVGRAGRLSPPA